MNPTTQLILPEVEELLKHQNYAAFREAMHQVHPADVAEVVAALDPSAGAIAFRLLARDDAASVLSYLDAHTQEAIVSELGTEVAASVIDAMSADDRVKLLDELPDSVAKRVVASLTPESRKAVQTILGYPQGSVGRLMTSNFIALRPSWTVSQAIEEVRRRGTDAETINVVYVTDEQGKLIDDLRLRQVILAPATARIDDLMNRSFASLRADEREENAVRLFARYGRTALPVVDSRGILVGIVTHDDVAEVAASIATGEMQRVGAVGVLEEPFHLASVTSLIRKRAPWLALLFLSELLTSNALVYFDKQIERAAILAVFLPAIISSGGNSGSQASTLVIRSLALGEIGVRDWFRILRRELLVAGILGLIIAVLGMLRVNLWGWLGLWTQKSVDSSGEVILNTSVQEHYVSLGVTIACSLFGVVVWGSVMGSMLPFLLKKCKFDPAGSSTPFVATLVDVTGIIIYFNVAMLLLRGSLL